jgi:5-methylcytosine-specific restriction protein B
MAHLLAPWAAAVYGAAARFTNRALRADGGLFTSRAVWSPPVLADLHERFVGQYTIEGATFGEKWSRQLARAPDDTLVLAAELLWVHVLFPSDLSGRTKRRLVQGTLAWARDPVTIPEPLSAVLDHGLGRTGVAFKTRRQAQLRFLLEAAQDIKRRPDPERDLLLRDPWACKAWLHGLPHDGALSQRAALLHLLHPATFEPIVSYRVKRRITDAFTDHVPAYVTDVDEALLHIRGALERTYGRGFTFTEPPVRDLWLPPTPDEPP